MHDPSPPLGRRQQIAARLARGEAVVSNDLAREFAMSEDAIRRDLRALAEAGQCQRVYGGALPPVSTPMRLRSAEGMAAKQALADVALPLIRPGMTLYLDTGSTNLALARVLPGGLHVVTPSISVAAALVDRADLVLHLLGGRADPVTGGCAGPAALAQLARFRLDLAFLGACTLSPDGSIAGFDDGDVELKRAALAQARESCVMLTADKIPQAGQDRPGSAPYVIAPLSAITHVVTLSAPDDAGAALLHRSGAVVHSPPTGAPG